MNECSDQEKTDNAATEIGEQWTSFCRDNRIDTKFTDNPKRKWKVNQYKII